MFNDIDWDKRTITIKRQVLRGPGQVTERLKTSASYATLPICDELFEKLQEWRKIDPYDFIVIDRNGEPFNPLYLNDFFRRKAKPLGIGFHMHMLHHSFATNLHASGVDMITAAKLTRHGDISVLTDIYTHPQDDLLREAIDKTYTKNAPNVNSGSKNPLN